MKSKKNLSPIDFELVEKWLENYCLDPLTSYLDVTEFRIDLYETENEWIVEALLNDYKSSEIKVFLKESNLEITATKHTANPKSQTKLRTINFPFQVINQKVIAHFNHGILEILISKIEKENGKNRFITLP